MDVLLVNPENTRGNNPFRDDSKYEPVELELIGGYLSAENISWDIWDGQVESEDFLQKLKRTEPSVVYIQGKVFQENYMLEYAACARELKATVIIGGEYAGSYPERFFKSCVDIILISNNFMIIPAVVRKDGLSYQSAPGTLINLAPLTTSVCNVPESEWVINPGKPSDMTKLPLPDRRYFMANSDSYKIYDHRPCAVISTYTPFGKRKTASEIASEIASVKVDSIYIDSDFLCDKKYIEDFCNAMNDSGVLRRLVFNGNNRFCVEHPGSVKALYDIGLCKVITDFSVADDISAKSVKGKKIKTQDEQAAEILRAANVETVGKFTLKLTDRQEDFKRVLKFVKRNKIRRFRLEIYQPQFTRDLFSSKNYSLNLVTTDPEAWDNVHITVNPTNMTVKEFYFNYYELMVKLIIRTGLTGEFRFKDFKAAVTPLLSSIFGNAK